MKPLRIPHRVPTASLALALSVVGPVAVDAAAQAAPGTAAAPDSAVDRDRAGELAPGFDRARSAVVHVFVEVRGRNTFRLERPASGVVVDAAGLVLTWVGLVAAASDADKALFVQTAVPGSTPLPATVVATDTATGLALLRVDGGGPWTALPIAATRARPGEPVGVLSFHDGADHAAFAGVATPALGAVAIGTASGAPMLPAADVLLTDAAIQRRSHGAALISAAGELLGLCNAEHVVEEVAEPTLEELTRPSFGFAVPGDVILRAFPGQLEGAARTAAPRIDARVAALAVAARSVVAVHRGHDERTPTVASDDPYARTRQDGVGSGVVLDPSGLVLTDAHLTEGVGALTVRTLDGDAFAARVVASDAALNAALLAVDLPAGRALPAIECADSDALVPGAPLFGIGNPLGHTPTITGGAMSARRGVGLQTDTRIGNENSGGALVDGAGRLVGLLDGGRVDKVVEAFRRRGDRTKVENGLDVTPSLTAVRAALRDPLTRLAGGNPSLLRPREPALDAPLVDTVAQIAGAMLNIYIEAVVAGASVDDNPFAPAVAATQVVSLGSGVVIDPRGLALTNWHVVDAATESDGSARADHVVRARTFDGRIYDVEVLSISREEDLALIRLAADGPVPAIGFASSAALQVGDTAVALGNPEGRANSVTVGVVTAKNQAIRVRGRWAKLPQLLETDAAINGGNSGGALVDARGRLIGINSAGGSAFNVTGYAIAVDHVRARLDDLLLGPHKLRSVYLGFEVLADADGLRIGSVDPTGPAARAGVRAGDALLAIGDARPRSRIDLAMLTRELAPAPTRLSVARDGVERELSIEPLDREVWWAQRQLGVELATVTVRDDAERIRAAATGFHRAFTGDPDGAPRLLPASLVQVARVHDPLLRLDGDAERELDPLQVGDLLLGVRIAQRIDGAETARLIAFTTPGDVRRAFQQHADYAGSAFDAWVWRDGRVRPLTLGARRLLP